jgi:CheY-like chemotaxis protein
LSVVTPRKILIVDDDQDGAASLGLLLEVCGHQPNVRYDGQSAIELLGKFRPEIALVDLSMPGIDGYELCRYIRMQPWGEEPYVFALTGWMHMERDALAAGFDGCLLKPCSLEHLKALLENPRVRSQRIRDLRRGPAAVLPHKPGNVDNA